jgi:hypothetical protein
MSAIASQTILSGDQMMKKSPRFSKLRVENLEERTLLAVMAGGIEQATELVAPTEATTWVVNTLEDPISWDMSDDVLSLREAISYTQKGDVIIFDTSLADGTITLNGKELTISKGITIDATSIGGITIDANNKSRVFNIDGGDSDYPTELNYLTITGGKTPKGAGIYGCGIYTTKTLNILNCNIIGNDGLGIERNGGVIFIANSIISGNCSKYSGGGIFTQDDFDRGSMTIVNSVISGNSASGGGGICHYSGVLVIINSTIAGNSATDGGGIDNRDGYLTLTNSIVALNYANVNNNVRDGNRPITESNNFIGLDPGFVNPPKFTDGKINNLDEIDLSLKADSSLIDAGDNEYVNGETDLAGNPRIVNEIVDIGAYEHQNGSEIDPTVITTPLDISNPNDGLISLREAISKAETGDVITFDDSLAGETITLNGEQLEISKGISIDASSVGGITINADGKSRVFYISGGDETAPVELINLTITGGNVTDASDGGGIFVDTGRLLKITNTTITGNYSKYGGGGISNNGSLTITTSSITNNSGGEGGGILTYDGKLTITNSLISANSARYGGGGIYNYYSEVSIVNSTISANTANKFGGGIYNETDLVLTNSIVALNFAHGDEDILGAYSGENNLIGVDPSFVVSPVYRYGDLVNADEIDLSLTARSVAINSGMNEVVETETDVAGKPRIVNGIVDLGAYEYQGAIPSEQLASPTILTGNKGVYVSYGANRHQITWDAIENASGYELTYTSDNRDGWTSVITTETSAVITGLTYGDDVAYRVRALGKGSFADSEWSEGKTFVVCPMDINGDGDIGGIDRVILAQSWLAEEGEDDFIPAADIDGNGDVGGIDRAFLANNWLNEVGVDDMIYPRPQAADVVFSEFASADLAVDLDMF